MSFFNKREPEKLVIEHFSFLVEQYGFTYTTYCYKSKKIQIKLELGHKTPRIFLNKVEEPDFVRLNLEWIFKFLHGKSPSENHDYLKYSLEENIRHLAKLIHQNSRQLIDEIDDWWIPAQVFMYKKIEKDYQAYGRADKLVIEYKDFYEYLKSKDAI